MKPAKWGFKTNPVRATAFVAINALLCTLAVIGFGALVDKAYSAPAADQRPVACGTTVGPLDCRVTKTKRRVARKLQDGEIKGARASFDMRGFFTQPQKSNRIMINRIQTALNASQGQPGSRVSGGVTKAYARSLWVQSATTPKCAGWGTRRYWSLNLSEDEQWCRVQQNYKALAGDGDAPEMVSAREVKIYGTVLVCGASITSVVLSGGSAGVVAAGAVASVGGCGLGLWSVW